MIRATCLKPPFGGTLSPIAKTGKCYIARIGAFYLAIIIFDEHASLKYNYGSRHFWAEGYYVSTVGLNKATVQKYIRDQELEDQASDRRSLKEYKDPFTGK